jgi:hypothetical protein
MATEPSRPAAPPRPNVLDFFLILLGACLSLALLHLPLPAITARNPADQFVAQKLLPWLTAAMRLPEGIILLWPIFFTLQRLFGRTQPITAVEWLWICVWCCVAVFVGLSVALPWIPREILQANRDYLTFWPPLVLYVMVAPAAALLAFFIGVFTAVRRTPNPWTHVFGVALLIWPVLPLVPLLLLGQFTLWINSL